MQMNVQEKGTILGRCVALISPEAILAFAYASLTSSAHAGGNSATPWNFFPVPSTSTYSLGFMP